MRHLQVGVLAAAAMLCVSVLAAQEAQKSLTSESKCCGLTGHQVFCGDEKCTSDKCRQDCEKGCAMLKAVGARVRDMAKAEWGEKACPCGEKVDAKSGDAKPAEAKTCENCKTFCKDVVVPQVKDRIETRTKDATLKHSVKNTEGKLVETPCTFLTGESCASCVTEISDKSFATLKEMKAAKKAPKTDK